MENRVTEKRVSNSRASNAMQQEKPVTRCFRKLMIFYKPCQVYKKKLILENSPSICNLQLKIHQAVQVTAIEGIMELHLWLNQMYPPAITWIK